MDFIGLLALAHMLHTYIVFHRCAQFRNEIIYRIRSTQWQMIQSRKKKPKNINERKMLNLTVMCVGVNRNKKNEHEMNTNFSK